jgi:hypothetical protein
VLDAVDSRRILSALLVDRQSGDRSDPSAEAAKNVLVVLRDAHV